MGDFSIDIAQVRKNAEKDVKDGAVVADYKADRQAVLKILDHALATEWVCVLRYLQNARMAQGILAEAVAQEFEEHAREEQTHAERIGERIKQLGGKPDLNPATLLQRSHSEYTEGESLVEMIQDNLIAERMVIEIYRDMIRFVGEGDPTTRRLFEDILENEEQHADELADLLISFDPYKKISN